MRGTPHVNFPDGPRPLRPMRSSQTVVVPSSSSDKNPKCPPPDRVDVGCVDYRQGSGRCRSGAVDVNAGVLPIPKELARV
jgi:hypothetical protein